MTIDNLYTIITNPSYLSATSLNLPATAVDSNGAVYTLLNSWIGNNLAVTGLTAPPQKTGASINIQGNLNILNTGQNLPGTISFTIVDSGGQPAADGNPAILIALPVPGTWTFALSFPLLNGSPLSNLSFKSIQLLLTSVAQPATTSYPALSQGLNFYAASLQTNSGLLNIVEGLLTSNNPVSISGSITILSGSIANYSTLAPGITIKSATVNISPAKFLPLPVYLQCTTSFAANSQTLQTSILLCTQVTIGTQPPIGLSMDISNPGMMLVFQADTALAVQHDLQELATFMANAPVGDVLKQYITNLSDIITLKAVRIYILTSFINTDITKAFNAIAVDVGSSSSWNVLPGYFNLEGFDVTFMVNNVTTSPALVTIVNGEVLLIDTVDMSASVIFPGLTFNADLITGPPLNLTQLFTKFFPAASGFPVLICNELSVAGIPNQSNYSLQAGFTGDWSINSGIREIKLEDASIGLAYDKSQTPATSGHLAATASFVSLNGDDIASFSVDWSIPGNFQLQGNFPDIHLSDLAKAIVGALNLSLPSGFPDLHLKNSVVTFTVLNPAAGNNTSGTAYDFSIVSTVSFNNTNIQLLFEIEKTNTGWGCVAGIWAKNWNWSPAQQWPSVFGTILSGISFSNAGLIISSIQNPTVQLQDPPSAIPSSIQPGLTFFTSISLSGEALQVLQKFFPNESAINFYAYFANPLTNSQFIGTIGNPSTTSKYSFDGLQFIISPATQSFSLQTGVSFSFTEIAGPNKGQTVNIDFVGGGTLSLEGEFSLYFVMKAAEVRQRALLAKRLQRHTYNRLVKKTVTANAPPVSSPGWKDPLGLQGITIEDFWGEVLVSAEGELGFGFGGNIAIGDTNPVELEMDLVAGIIDGEIPDLNAFIFKLIEQDQNTPVELTDIIKEFTSLDLSWVPVLNGIGFKQFQLYIVLDPAGWKNPATGTNYLPGFYSSGDITFYGFEAVFDIAIYFSSGIKASGYINNPLSLAGGLLALSDATGTKGPYGLIDTTFLTNPNPGKPYLTLSGSITLLGLSDTLYCYIKNSGFYFEMTLKQFILTEKVVCNLGYSNGAFNFLGSIGGSIGFTLNTPAISLNSIVTIPAITGFTFDLDLTITITINPGFTFNVAGSFTWGSLTLTVNFNLINITSWSDLKQALINFFVATPEQLFRDLISDAKKWASAIEQKLFTVADDIGEILADGFKIAYSEAVSILDDLGWGAQQIEAALVAYWKQTESEAKQIVSDILNYCAVDQAYGLLSSPTPYTMRPDAHLLQSLVTAPQAQPMLYHYYMAQQGIHDLGTHDPSIRQRLQRMLKDHVSSANDHYAVEDIIGLLNELKKKGTPALQAQLDPLISLLRPYRTYSYQAFIAKMHEL